MWVNRSNDLIMRVSWYTTLSIIAVVIVTSHLSLTEKLLGLMGVSGILFATSDLKEKLESLLEEIGKWVSSTFSTNKRAYLSQKSKLSSIKVGVVALTSFLKVKILRVRNLFLSVDEREEWLGDLREAVDHMRYVEKRSKWYIKRYVFVQHVYFGWSKLQILLFNMASRISKS